MLQRADVALYAAKRHGRNRAEGVPEEQQEFSPATRPQELNADSDNHVAVRRP